MFFTVTKPLLVVWTAPFGAVISPDGTSQALDQVKLPFVPLPVIDRHPEANRLMVPDRVSVTAQAETSFAGGVAVTLSTPPPVDGVKLPLTLRGTAPEFCWTQLFTAVPAIVADPPTRAP